jgi:hypothetical protein
MAIKTSTLNAILSTVHPSERAAMRTRNLTITLKPVTAQIVTVPNGFAVQYSDNRGLVPCVNLQTARYLVQQAKSSK